MKSNCVSTSQNSSLDGMVVTSGSALLQLDSFGTVVTSDRPRQAELVRRAEVSRPTRPSCALLPGELGETEAEVFEQSFQLAAEANGIGFGVL